MSGGWLALVWDPADAAGRPDHIRALMAREWTCLLARAGLEVWARNAARTPVTVLDDGAVLVGRHHPRLPAQPDLAGRGECGGVAAQAARLCRDRWGGFAALLRAPSDGAVWALRDPSGAMEVLTWSADGVQVVASELAGVPPRLWPRELALDWDVICDFIRRPWAMAAGSALQGVRALAPGRLRRLAPGEPAELAVWRPIDAISADPGPQLDQAARLREVVTGAVTAMASSHQVMLTELSGGLDSAIVTAALASGGAMDRVRSCLHYFGDRPDSDERAWAAAVTAHCGLPLRTIARSLEPFHPERDFLPLASGARPPAGALDSWRDRSTATELHAAGATALLTGMGGDAAFFQFPTPLVLADLWRATGPRALLDPLVPDVARWLRRSVWSVGAEALRALRPGPHPEPPSPFAGARARSAGPAAEHPWLQGLDALPPARRLQVVAFTGLQSTLGRNRRTEHAEVLHPLLSQPVLELCLAIPTWRHVEGGRDRALARRAFTGLLPPAVLDRRSKGELTSHFSRRVAASLEALRPWLLDGALVRAQVLDRQAVEAALTPESLIRRPDGLALVSAAAVEAWVRWWQSQIPDVAAAPRRRPS